MAPIHSWRGTPQFHDPKNLRAGDGPRRWCRLCHQRTESGLGLQRDDRDACGHLSDAGPSKGMAGGGVAFIPLNLPGVSKGKPLDKMGQRALNQGSITFTNVRIPKRYLLFDTASYETILNQTLVLTNGAMGAVFTGVARAAYEQALAYTKTQAAGRQADLRTSTGAKTSLRHVYESRNQPGTVPGGDGV